MAQVTTVAWENRINRHYKYDAIGSDVQNERDSLIRNIERRWSNTDMADWIPHDIRPKGLPVKPRNWSRELLTALKDLAEMTDKDMKRAHYFMRLAPTYNDRGGWKNGVIGADDVWVARDMCNKADGRAEGRQEHGQATNTLHGGSQAADPAAAAYETLHGLHGADPLALGKDCEMDGMEQVVSPQSLVLLRGSPGTQQHPPADAGATTGQNSHYGINMPGLPSNVFGPRPFAQPAFGQNSFDQHFHMPFDLPQAQDLWAHLGGSTA